MAGRRRSLSGLALTVAAVLVGGCGGSQVPPVPVIDDARDARGADPCGLLSADQLTALGLRALGTAGRVPEGPRCEWRGDGATTLAVTLFTEGDGLATLARNSEPTTTRVRVAGYPALETFTGRGEFCQYDVGVATNQVVSAALDAPAPDSCTVLQSVVPLLVDNLPPLRG